MVLLKDSSPYKSETYKGVEIRLRCVLNPRNGFWCGSYSFFTGRITEKRNERVCGAVTEALSTEEDAVDAAFVAGRKAVDKEIRIQALMARP